jgi:hypothetical protein
VVRSLLNRTARALSGTLAGIGPIDAPGLIPRNNALWMDWRIKPG